MSVLAGCNGGGGGGTTGGGTTTANLVSIEVSPLNPSIAVGTTTQLKATGIFSDNTKQDLTSSVVWNSSNTAIATVSGGLVRSIVAGSATITASSGGVSGSTALTVTSATLVAIQVTPTNPRVAKGTTRQFVATGIFSDNSLQDLTTQVTWTTSDSVIATISNATGSNGLATALGVGSSVVNGVGTTVVRASLGNVTGTTNLVVTPATLTAIQVAPISPSIAKGTTRQFAATGVFSDSSVQDLTTQVVWSSSNSSVATISNTAGSNGLATSVATGSTVITAVLGGIFGTTTLTVTSATLVSIEVAPTNPSIAKGTNRQLTATGIYSDNSVQDLTEAVIWSSSAPSVANISNATDSSGSVTGLAAGSTVIKAVSGSVTGTTTLVVTGATLVSIEISPAATTIPLQTTQQFTAQGIFNDNSVQDLTGKVTWSSSDATVAVISNGTGSHGLAVPVLSGTTTITVITATIVAPSGGATLSSSTTLTVTPATLSSISVTPANPKMALGTTQQFIATGTYSDNSTFDLTDFVAWSSSNPSVASISNTAGTKGLAAPVASGSTVITAAFGEILTNTTLSDSTTLTVSTATLRSISVQPVNPQIALNTTVRFTATGTFSDNSTQDLTDKVTWSSSFATVATISNGAESKGLATAVGGGQTSIRAVLGSVSGSTTLSVFTAGLVSIVVTPAGPSILIGDTQQFTATGSFANGITQDLTQQVLWSSTQTNVATVSNAPDLNGLATGVGAGVASIRATKSGISGSSTLTVSP